jgi:hypothetical protein
MHLSGINSKFQEIAWLVLKTGVPSPVGVFDELPPAVWGFVMPLKKRIRESMAEFQKLSDYDLLSALAFLLNNNVLYVDRLIGDASLYVSRYEIPLHSPIAVAGKTSRFDVRFDISNHASEDELTAVLARLRVDSKRHSLIELPLLDGPEVNLGTDPSCELIEHQVRNQRVDIVARVDAPCFARLAYAYYPHLRVSVDGREVEKYETGTRFLAIRLNAGEHRIEIVPRLSPLRRLFLGINILVLLAYLTFLYRDRGSD